MNRKFVRQCGIVGCALGAGLAAGSASAASRSPSNSALSPFAPLSGAAAAYAGAAAVLRSTVQARGAAHDNGLVPGTEQELSIEGACQSSDPERGSCVGTTTYSFDTEQITLLSASGIGGNCALGPETWQVSCEIDLRPEQGYRMSTKLKIDADARDRTVIDLSAVGNYTVEPDRLFAGLDPQATLQVTQSPDPMLVENGAQVPLMATRVVVRNDGPSAAHDVESREAFSAQPPLVVDIDQDSADLCKGGAYQAITCRYGSIGPGEARIYSFTAALPSQVPSGASDATVELSADVGAGVPVRFSVLHVGREFVGLLKYPEAAVRGRAFAVDVEFVNAMPPTARAEAIPLEWTFDGGDDLEIVDYLAKSGRLACRREAADRQLVCETPDITSPGRSGDATVTLRSRRSGLVPAKLSWNAAAWGNGSSVYTLPVDEPDSR